MKNLILTELKLRSTDWANVANKYRNRDGVTITRGKTSTEGQAGPSQANITLDNTGGVFSPRNPSSPIHGQFGRNTPLRVSVVRDAASLGMVVAGAGRAQANDSVALSITGDIDGRVDLEPTSGDWSVQSMDLASKFNWVVGQLGWSFHIVAGTPRLNWWVGVNSPPVMEANATVGVSGTGRKAFRFTLDVDNGAAGNTVTFYTAPTIAGPWTQLGAPVVQAGVTSIFDNTVQVRVGAASATSPYSHGHSEATFYAFELRNGIGGTVVASPNFTTQPLDPVPFSSSTFTDAQGNSWSFNGGADAARIWYGKTWTRFVGEVAEWPPRWDPSHSDKYVPITANGILRRLGQGRAPVATSLRDYILQPSLTDALAFYVPLEGQEGTTYSLNLAPLNYYLQTRFYPWSFTGVRQPVYTYGQDMGAAWIGTGVQINATGDTTTGDPSALIGDPATADQNCALDFVFQSNSLGVFTIQLEDYDGNLWNLILDTPTNDGTAEVRFHAADTGSDFGFTPTASLQALQDTALHHLRFQVTKNGADTDFVVYIDGVSVKSGTKTGYVMNGWARFSLFYSRYVNQTYVNVAHIACWANANAAEIPPIADMVAAAFGYAGETAADRIIRVCGDGNIPVVIVGAAADTTKMGPQFAEGRLAQIRDAEATDFGILTEKRDDNALRYRTRASMYAQTPTAVVDYAQGHVAPPFEPVDDDAATRNDVTASRRDGGSYKLALTAGPMSVLDPPAGIGQYEDEVTVNVESDAQLPGAASWWLTLGTLDAARIESVTFNLAAAEIQDDPALLAAILSLDVGDRMLIENISAADIADDFDVIVQGYTETITNTTWEITFTCAPGAPYDVAKFDAARYDHAGSTLGAAVTNSATSLSLVTQPGDALWTTDPAAFPFDLNIEGEQVRVVNITGATSPQTALAARSINGVVAAHAAGATVRLWDTPRFAY